MTTDQLFSLFLFTGLYFSCLLLLDGAHKAHIAALKSAHREESAALRGYIRTLHRERKWFEAELAKQKAKAEQRRNFDYIVGNPPFGAVQGKYEVSADPVREPFGHQWLPPSEEYEERD